MATRAPLGAELLERTHELDRIAAHLDSARASRGGVFVVEGPPGIGKTALLTAARGMADGMTALGGVGAELEREFPLGIARQLFEPAARGSGHARAFRGAAVRALSLFDGEPEPPDSAGGIDYALYWLTANLAEEQPLLLLVDDAQWADAASLRFLAFLSRRIEDLPVALLLARRPADPGTDPSLEEVASPRAAEIAVPAPLSPGASGELIAGDLDSVPDEQFVEACHRATGGNPLYLRQLAAEVQAERLAPKASDAARVEGLTPRGLGPVIGARLARLPAPATALARALALLRDGMPLRVAASVAGLELQTAEAMADALARAFILDEDRPPRFAHPIVRASIQALTPPAERSAGHARAAWLLAEEGRPPEQVAAHLLQTEPSGDPAVVEALLAAAGGALGRGAPEAAAVYLLRALEEPPRPGDRVAVLIELAAAEWRAGDERAIAHAREALTASERGEDVTRAASQLASALLTAGRIAEAAGELEAAIARVGERDRESALRLEAQLQWSAQLDISSPEHLRRRIERYAELEGDTAGERLALASLAQHTAISGGSASDAAAIAERALHGEALLHDQGPDAPAALSTLAVLVAADRFEVADRLFDRALARSTENGSVVGFAYCSALRALSAYRRGAIAAAEEEARAATDAARENGLDTALATAAAMLAIALIERGELERAAAELDQSVLGESTRESRLYSRLLRARALLAATRGDTDAALADLLELHDRERIAGVAAMSLSWRPDAIRLLAARGDQEHALRLAAEEEERARMWDTPRARGIALHCRGLALGAGGIDLLAEAARVLATSPARLELARALVDHGAALRRARRRSDARGVLVRGLDAARGCGATALAEHALEELRTAGARPRRLAFDGLDALTASERRVARMVASGMSNREVAERLFVTRRTVETHLTHAYQKLGIASRDALPDALGDTT